MIAFTPLLAQHTIFDIDCPIFSYLGLDGSQQNKSAELEVMV